MSLHKLTGEMLVSLVLDTMVCPVITTKQNSYDHSVKVLIYRKHELVIQRVPLWPHYEPKTP